MKKKEVLLLFLLFLTILINQVFAETLAAETMPVYVGSLSASTTYSYWFNFTSDSGCTTVLFSNKTSITTNIDGIGAANVGIATLKSPPAFICEYRAGTLIKAHQVESNIFNNVYVHRNFVVGSGTYNASRILAIANSSALNNTITALRINNVSANKGIAALRTNNASAKKTISQIANFSNVTTYNVSGTYTWTKPVSKGADLVRIELWGAGGSGGCGGSTDGGAGGGGGGYVAVTLPLSALGATVKCKVGAGGARTTCGVGDINGQSGGNTSFSNISVYGGGGGIGSTSSNSGGGGGGDIIGPGLFGTGALSAAGGVCGGTTYCVGMYGGNGGAGAASASSGKNSIFGGAGGGGGGTTIGGAGGNSTFGGAGGGGGGGTTGGAPGGVSIYGGNGGVGNTGAAAGTDGKIPGGGGGGSETGTMGAGADGQCRITVW